MLHIHLHSTINTTYRFHSINRLGSAVGNVILLRLLPVLLRWQSTRAQYTFDSWASGSIINHVTPTFYSVSSQILTKPNPGHPIGPALNLQAP